tara:strand:- start:3623 stop:5713 length:2091 start_codon:yes stop_codon:yes gene_type:complete
MTVHNRRHRRTLLKESNLLLEYSRIKNRSGWEYKGLWEVIDEAYGHQLTEERLDEAVKLFSWLSNLGKGAIEKMKGLAKSKLDSAQYKEAEETGNALKNQPIANEVRGLWKQGKYKQAFSTLSTFLTASSEQGTIAEGRLLEFGTIGTWWRDTSTAVRLFFMIPVIAVIMGAGGMDKEVQMDTDQQPGIEQVVKVVNNDDADFNILDIKPVKDDLQAGDEANIQNAGYETGVQFEKGSYDLDANSIKQLNDIAEKYVDDVQALVDAGYTNVTLDLDAAGGASNTGSGWDTPNDGTNKSLRELRADSGGDTLLDAVNKKLAEKGLDGVVKVKLTKKVTNQGGEETVKSGAKDNHQNSIFSGAVDGQPPAAETETVNIDAYNPEFAPIGGDGPTKVLPPTPGVAKGSRNLEYRDLLYLGGIDPIPVTFGDYKSDADMGRVDWRDVDVQGNKFLQDQQKMAVWITNTRKAKFPILKRTKNALQGIIDIEFDGAKYLGNVGPKYDPSTTTPLTQKRTMGKRGPNKFVPDTEKGGYMGNPALTEAKGELPPEFIKEPEIPPKIKSLQGNTTALWKYILGNKALGDVITSQVAGEFDKNIKEYLEQLDLMYGNSGTRGNVNFRYRRNPNYTGSKYKNISDTWNEKITGGVEDIQPTGGEQEVYPQKQSWTGAYTPTPSGEVIDLLPDNELQEQIKRIKKLMI